MVALKTVAENVPRPVDMVVLVVAKVWTLVLVTKVVPRLALAVAKEVNLCKCKCKAASMVPELNLAAMDSSQPSQAK